MAPHGAIPGRRPFSHQGDGGVTPSSLWWAREGVPSPLSMISWQVVAGDA